MYWFCYLLACEQLKMSAQVRSFLCHRPLCSSTLRSVINSIVAALGGQMGNIRWDVRGLCLGWILEPTCHPVCHCPQSESVCRLLEALQNLLRVTAVVCPALVGQFTHSPLDFQLGSFYSGVQDVP